MKIQFLTSCVSTYGAYGQGEVATIPTHIAKRWIKRGVAIRAGIKPAPAVIPEGMLWCTECEQLHKKDSRIAKRHIKLMAKQEEEARIAAEAEEVRLAEEAKAAEEAEEKARQEAEALAEQELEEAQRKAEEEADKAREEAEEKAKQEAEAQTEADRIEAERLEAENQPPADSEV